MPNCSVCGKPMPKVPSWLDSASVSFRCNACPGPTLAIAPSLSDFDEGDEKVDDVLGEVDIEMESLDSLEDLDETEALEDEED